MSNLWGYIEDYANCGRAERTKRIFLIAPVRGISDTYKDGIQTQVEWLEQQGYDVHWPMRDTPQDATEKEICDTNYLAIRQCDEVRIIWDGKSQGCLFDLGMAFALGKPIKSIAGYFPRATREKSFANLVYTLEEM